MSSTFLDRVAATIRPINLVKSTGFCLRLVVNHGLLAFLLYLPLCMQAQAEPLVQLAKRLEDDFQAIHGFVDIDEIWHQADFIDIEADYKTEWLNSDFSKLRALKSLRKAWKKHIESSQSRWMKTLGVYIPIAINFVDVVAGPKNRVLTSLLVVRAMAASLHLFLFHVIFYPKVKDLSFLMKNMPNVKDLTSPLWLCLSLPLASILWSIVFGLLLAISYVREPFATSDYKDRLDIPAAPIFVCLLPDIILLAWITYQIRRLL